MNQDRWAAVDHYITDLLVRPDPALEAALADSDAAGLPSINVSPNHGKLLHLLARLQGARTILEIGTLGGYSTIWLARALPADGRLHDRVQPKACRGGPRQHRALWPQPHRGRAARTGPGDPATNRGRGPRAIST